TENHLLAVPEGVIIALSIMNESVQGKAAAINGITPEDIPVKIIGLAEICVRVYRTLVASSRARVRDPRGPGEFFSTGTIENCPALALAAAGPKGGPSRSPGPSGRFTSGDASRG